MINGKMAVLVLSIVSITSLSLTSWCAIQDAEGLLAQRQQCYTIISVVLVGTNCLNDKTCSAEAPHSSTIVLFRGMGLLPFQGNKLLPAAHLLC